MALIGRAAERAAIDRILETARSGMSGALVIGGDAGIGKTTLLDYAAIVAGDVFRVERVAGYESERGLAFAAVHRLLRPFLDQRAGLPGMQRAAIESAFGLADAPPPADRFLVGLATLSLLADAAGKRPLLCLIDDAQWLDEESLAVLAFAARRLEAERVAVVFAAGARERDPLPLEALPSLHVDGLPAPDALELLHSVVHGTLDRMIAERVVAETAGSPLALIELAGGLSAEQVASSALSPEPLPIGQRLEAHFLNQVRALPAETQQLMLIAAAEASGESILVGAAAELIGVPAEAAEPAERAGLLTIHAAYRFRHPLLRAAVYAGAGIGERRRVHRALAQAAASTGDLDRHAWHLGVATERPDERVAAQLAAAGNRALRRGGCAASSEFYLRAAELSPDRGRRVDRALAAAERHLTAGFRVRARHVVSELAAEIDDPLQRARAAQLEGMIRYVTGETRDTVPILLDAARALQPFDVHRARAAVLRALAAARVTGPFALPGETVADVSAVARALQLPAWAEPTIGDLLLDGDATLFLDGHHAAVPTLQRALAALEGDDSETEEMLWWLAIGSWAAGALGDDEQLRRLASRMERVARAHLAMVPLSIALMFIGLAELFAGNLRAAGTYLDERAELLAAVGRRTDAGPLSVMAWTGPEAAVRAEAAEIAAYARETRHGWMLPFVDYALTVLELGLGNYAAAVKSTSKDYEDNPFLNVAAFPHLVEAAIRDGDRETAERALQELASRAVVNRTPLALGLLARSKALLADDADAEALYLEALEHLTKRPGALPRAHTHLLYGEWLRRRKRSREARQHLRAAHDSFTEMGAERFAQRAWSELAATGERSRRRTVDTSTELTPQERRIAELAATGATNREIAHRLYLSASTVDYHLRKAYRKLNVTSRRELSRALPR